MSSYFNSDGCGGVDGCSFAADPPPVFDLPPPPRPPWLDELDDCDAKEAVAVLESCDNTLIVDATDFESTFHSIAVVVVCAIIVVMFSLVLGVVVFR